MSTVSLTYFAGCPATGTNIARNMYALQPDTDSMLAKPSDIHTGSCQLALHGRLHATLSACALCWRCPTYVRVKNRVAKGRCTYVLSANLMVQSDIRTRLRNDASFKWQSTICKSASAGLYT